MPDPFLSSDARSLLDGFSATQPRTRSGACFNVGRDTWAHSPRGDVAMRELRESGMIVPAPGKAWGWWLLSDSGASRARRNPRHNPKKRHNVGAPAHRIDTDAAFDRRTGKRAAAQKALNRIVKANDLGYFLDHRGWYRQDQAEHFIEMVGSGGRDAMARGSRYRKYLSPAESAQLNAFVAGKGRLP